MNYYNLKKKDLLCIVADSSRTEMETALAAKCILLENEIGRMNNDFNDFFQFLYSVDRFIVKFKQKHGLEYKFRCKSQANEIGELRSRFKNGKQDIKVDHEEKEDK